VKKLFYIWLLCAIFSALPAIAGEISAEKMMSSTDSLSFRKDYHKAGPEYKWVIFFNPQHLLAKVNRHMESFFKSERCDQAIILFGKLSDERQVDGTGARALFRLGEIHCQKSDNDKAKPDYLNKQYSLSYYLDEQKNHTNLVMLEVNF
jgi:hypothetical protein